MSCRTGLPHWIAAVQGQIKEGDTTKKKQDSKGHQTQRRVVVLVFLFTSTMPNRNTSLLNLMVLWLLE
jgi:hypothetical protein